MDFLNGPILWHLLWVFPLLLLLLFWALSRRRRLLKLILGSRAEQADYTTVSKGKRLLRFWLFIIALLFLFIAAARPYWGTRILPFSGRGRDLMVVLDVSRSMLADDIKPSRLEHAKWFLRELIKKTPGDRYGIVAFSGAAFLECPMTVDKTSLFQCIGELNPKSIPLGGTNIQRALETSLIAFSAAEGGHRAIILVTDGDELQGQSVKVISELKEQQIPIYVIGIGDPGGTGLIRVPTDDGKAKVILRDKKGEVVTSKLNEKQLRNLALSSTEGIYIRSTVTDPGLKAVLKKIKALVPEEYERGNNTRPIERFHFPLMAALLLLLIRLGISERRNSAAILLLCLLPLGLNLTGQVPGPGPVKSDSAPVPNVLTENQADNPIPAESLKTAESEPVDLYNQALQAHEQADLKSAVNLYEQAINAAGKNREIQNRSYQNLGVIDHEKARSLLQQKKLDDALKVLASAEEWYRESLRSNDGPGQTALNQQLLLQDRKVIRQMKEMQKQLQQQQQEAQKKTREALDQQQQANQQQQKKEQQEDQKQKDQQQSQTKQDQQQEKQQQQQQTEKKTEEAMQAVKDLQEQAKQQGQKKTEQMAKAAAQELRQAKQEQQQKDGEKAEEHLKKALEKLGVDKDSAKNKAENQKQDKQEGQQDQPEEQPGQQEDQPDQMAGEDPPPGSADMPESADPREEKDIDPNQAEALLDLMANEEQSLRDRLRERMLKNARIKPVDRDW